MHPSVSAYHIVLRTTALAVALVLLFDSGLLSGVTKELSQSAQTHVANVISVGAAIETTEINALTTAISIRDQELDAREAAIRDREIEVGLNPDNSATSSDLSTYLLSIVLFILTVLIVLNYALDFTRRPVVLKPRTAHE